jgi:predicted esterase
MRQLDLGCGRGVGIGLGAALLAAVACGSGSAHTAKIGGQGGLGGTGGSSGTSGNAGDGNEGGGAGANEAGSSGTTGGTGGTSGSGGSGGFAAGQGVGEDCSSEDRCRSGLECSDGECSPAGTVGVGMPCVIGPECESGLNCVLGSCVPEGELEEGEECLLDSKCASGLRCTFQGLAAVCAPSGDTDLGGACTANADCYQGLGCAKGVCALLTSDFEVWPGVECEEPSDDDVRAYFELPGADGSLEGDFFRLPFPNDVRRSASGLDLSGFPTPGPAAIGVDAVKLYVDAIEANDDGWGTDPTVTFRFSGRVVIPDVDTEIALAWIDVTPGQSSPWASVGLSWVNFYGRNRYLCENSISAKRPQGYPLTPGHTYAVYLTTGIKSFEGDTVIRPPQLVSLLGSSAPNDSALDAAYAAYAPFRDYLAATNIEPASILNASVFTVGEVRDIMADVADAIAAADPPEVDSGSWTKCDSGVASPCSDRTGDRDCVAEGDDFEEYHARVKLPIFQQGFAQGKAPYVSPADGGGIVIESSQPTEEVCLSLTVPKGGTMPVAGWPLVVFAHGTGGNFRDHVSASVAGALSTASVPFAVLGIDQVTHGPRRGDSTISPDQLFFNFLNPQAARGNPIQGAADQLSLARFAATIDGSGENPTTIDPANLFFFGHSQGATEGSLMLPYGDAYKAAVLSGNGASLANALLSKTKPVNIKDVYPFAIADTDAAGDGSHPVLTLLQQWIDPAEPQNFAIVTAKEPLMNHTAKHVFQTYGTGDSYSPPVTLGIYAKAGRFTQVNPELEDIGLAAEDAPLAGNEQSGMITLGMRQYEPPSGRDGHFVVFDVPTANEDMVRFLTEAVSGVPNIGE